MRTAMALVAGRGVLGKKNLKSQIPIAFRLISGIVLLQSVRTTSRTSPSHTTWEPH